MKWADRILTIVVTATLTSAVWIVAGGSLIEMASGEGQREVTRPSDAQPSPAVQTDSLPSERGQATSNIVSSGLDDKSAAAIPGDSQRNLMIPVLNVRPEDLTDTFADEREGGGRLHEAIDIMAPEGTTVVSAAAGRIEKLFRSKAGGNTIYVRSPDEQAIYYYAHLKEYAQGLKEGQQVRRGQRLGAVGSSGNASADAPHLHFALLRTTPDAAWWEPANALNPYPLLGGKKNAGSGK
ncbi:peptidoglycan DD-metalloendopeptidase family protein [Erythrobacter sp. 3-20A1M]|uniref:M23 family metallopeptidase n=1 Tax=Erythrobacter sp. 3-20A1M TaxID=2653850 RepID=UPI001BFCCB19|nr:M23 family metallopeptidase [Erythrobacter sp. 3-20A1M]QWC58027.1 peptidoglycan DD-metalloendopeptidase family protein [Erythrobacter sp. 3-20A1M]